MRNIERPNLHDQSEPPCKRHQQDGRTHTRKARRHDDACVSGATGARSRAILGSERHVRGRSRMRCANCRGLLTVPEAANDHQENHRGCSVKGPFGSFRLDMNAVRKHYDARVRVSTRMKRLFNDGDANAFALLALGISDGHGNYSARDHKLGPRILAAVTAGDVFRLAEEIMGAPDVRSMLETVYRRNIPFLKVSVGSEIGMMLKPKQFWVVNTRSVWAHLLVKHRFKKGAANEELRLYRDDEQISEMEYNKWRAIGAEMEPTLEDLASRGDIEASRQAVVPGERRNIWSDALASALYDLR
jgi:hypothetical protein